MSQETIEVLFALRLPDGLVAEEDALAKAPSSVAQALGGPAAPYGHLVLRGGTQPELRLPDDLLPLASALVAVLPSLHAGGETAIAAYSQPFAWSFTPAGSRVTTAWTETETERGRRTDDAAALVPALTAATRRLVELLSGGKAGGASTARLLQTLADRLDQLDPRPA